MATRFKVEDIDESKGDDNGTNLPTILVEGESTHAKGEDINDGNEDYNQFTLTSEGGNLALYEAELKKRPKISTVLSTLVGYEPVLPNPKKGKGKGKKSKGGKLGTIMGVYLPTLQNILGVILFLRMTWIVGTAGVGQAFLLVFLCCFCTFLTTLSLSAIATNGVVPGGGSYFMISRNLGPEFGGAVGILFYLANTFGTSLYTLGAIEILLTYIAPQAALFGEIRGNPEVLYNNLRIYGTILLLLMSVVVFVGVKFVSYFASVCLVAVIIAVVSIYAGALNPIERGELCTVNGVALIGGFRCPPPFNISANDTVSCSEENIDLQRIYMAVPSSLGVNMTIYDPTRDQPWQEGFEPTCQTGIPGISRTRTIVDNTPSMFLEKGDGAPGIPAIGNQVQAAITSSFLVLIGIFFPSVTGIMAGSNRSGDLKDAQKSIPVGTIAAQLTTTVIYLTCVLFFGGTVAGVLLRDQFGDATGDLTVSLLAFPTKWIILIGALLSTIGAGLQTLTGAPRLLQAIANDNLIPILRLFKIVSPLNHEPTFALILTALLAEVGVLIASLDLVAPILSMFYLMCYMFVNVACTLQSLLKSPGWRPRFKFYHWTTSLLGALMCLAIMFMISWYYALVAMVIAILIYKYIEFRGAEKEWGDGIRGLSMEAARLSLLRLEERPPHTKNWRPQLLVLVRLNDDLIPTHPKLLAFASQLKAGKGLTLICSVVKGDFNEMVAECVAAKQSLKRFADDNKVQGITKVIAAPNTPDGMSFFIQAAGLGGMTHNTIMISWPSRWRRTSSWMPFIKAIRAASKRELAVLVAKGVNWYPSNVDRMKGFIDVWWIVHDGGLLMLLPFLLRQHKVWRSCQLRIFAVAQVEDNSIQMKKDLAMFLYQLRIEAEVDVIEMPNNDISAYTYERTLMMEQRHDMLKQMRLTRQQSKKEIQSVLSRSFSRQQSIPMDSIRESPIKEVSGSLIEGGDQSHVPPLTPGPSILYTVRDDSSSDSEELSAQTPLLASTNAAASLGTTTATTASKPTLSIPVITTTPVTGTETPGTETPGTGTTGVDSNVRDYDTMFISEAPVEGTDGIPLGGTARTLFNDQPQPHEENIRRMNTSVKLNELIVNRSHESALVIVNLPGPPVKQDAEENYMEFLDVLTEGLDRVLLVRGGGREVVTIYS